MTFTFDLADDIGKVRFEIGDTAEPALFMDEEITYKLTEQGSVLLAAAALCDVRATQLAGAVDFTTDDQSFKQSQARLGWESRASAIRARIEDAEGDVSVLDVQREDDVALDVGETGRLPYPYKDRIEELG